MSLYLILSRYKSFPRRVGDASRAPCRVLGAQVQPVLAWGACLRGRQARHGHDGRGASSGSAGPRTVAVVSASEALKGAETRTGTELDFTKREEAAGGMRGDVLTCERRRLR